MKKLTTLLLVLAMILTLGVGISAEAPSSDEANQVVARGTAVIDGEVDDIYKESLTIVYDGDPAKNAFPNQDWNSADTMTAYAVYDDEYVYLIADVKDNDVLSADKDWILTDMNPYLNDVVEFRLNFDGEHMFKVGIDAFGIRAYTIQPQCCDIETVKYAATQNDDGYIVEIAVPHGLKDENDLFASRKLGLKIWVWDLIESGAGKVAPVQDVDTRAYSILYGTEEEAGSHGTPVFYELVYKAGSDDDFSDDDIVVGGDTDVAEGDDTTAAEGDDTTAAEGDDTTAAEGDNTTAAEGDDTTAADTTGEDDKSSFPVVPVVIIVAAVVVIAVIAAIVAKSKKK